MSAIDSPVRTPRLTGRAVLAWAVLAFITAALLGPLRHSAPGPQSFDEAGLRLLIDQLGPSAPLLWLVRVGASATAAAHLALLTLGVAARAVGALRAVRVLDGISPAIIRRLLTPLTVVSLTGTMSLSALASAAAATPTLPPPAVMVVATPIASTPIASTTTETPATKPPATEPPTTAVPEATIEVDSIVMDATEVIIGGSVIVARGDSMWSIAENALRTHLGHAPTANETSQYWRALIDANRDRLRDHDDPGLIFAGQLFVLP